MAMAAIEPETPTPPQNLRLHLLAIAIGGGLALAVGEPASAIAAEVWTNFMFPAFERMFEVAGLKLC